MISVVNARTDARSNPAGQWAIQWTQGFRIALASASALTGKLAGEGRRLPNPHILIRPFGRREAVLWRERRTFLGAGSGKDLVLRGTSGAAATRPSPGRP
ncbi:MAG: hypothetical protein JOZ14_10420 [Acidobacteria bacterium]|nr:hypothetical protein [Acidobacteriota bacterium]